MTLRANPYLAKLACSNNWPTLLHCASQNLVRLQLHRRHTRLRKLGAALVLVRTIRHRRNLNHNSTFALKLCCYFGWTNEMNLLCNNFSLGRWIQTTLQGEFLHQSAYSQTSLCSTWQITSFLDPFQFPPVVLQDLTYLHKPNICKSLDISSFSLSQKCILNIGVF